MFTELEESILLRTFPYSNNTNNKLSNNGMYCSYYSQTFWHQFAKWSFSELETCYLCKLTNAN